jgi:hypothetical protein
MDVTVRPVMSGYYCVKWISVMCHEMWNVFVSIIIYIWGVRNCASVFSHFIGLCFGSDAIQSVRHERQSLVSFRVSGRIWIESPSQLNRAEYSWFYSFISEFSLLLRSCFIYIYTYIISFWNTVGFDLSIVRYSKEHSVSEAGYVCFLRWASGRHLLCWASLKELTAIIYKTSPF